MRGCFLLVVVLLGACNVKTADAPADRPAAKAPVAEVATTKLGDAITGSPIALAAIAKDPASFANKTVVTTGTVTAVCQAMGCWMEIQDETGEAHVKMHGHSFFVPKTSSGHKARVQAIVEKTDPDEECSHEAEQQLARPVAKVQLDATGVELID
jgi:hypothetical protein